MGSIPNHLIRTEERVGLVKGQELCRDGIAVGHSNMVYRSGTNSTSSVLSSPLLDWVQEDDSMTLEPATAGRNKPITPEEVLLNHAMSCATISHDTAGASAPAYFATAAPRAPWINIGDALFALNHTSDTEDEDYVAPGSIMPDDLAICPLDTLLNVGARSTAVNTGVPNTIAEMNIPTKLGADLQAQQMF